MINQTSPLLSSAAVVDCGSPEVPPMAHVVFGSHDNSTRFGATMHLSCEGDAFQLQPNITSRPLNYTLTVTIINYSILYVNCTLIITIL